MMKNKKEEIFALIEKATAGDSQSLETLIGSVQDLVFNLSLRMLGTFRYPLPAALRFAL